MLKIFVVLYIIYLLQRKDDYNADEFGESGIDHDFVRITYEIVLTLVIVILIKYVYGVVYYISILSTELLYCPGKRSIDLQLTVGII